MLKIESASERQCPTIVCVFVCERGSAQVDNTAEARKGAI